MARAAISGGAAGIRANGPADIRAIREVTTAPIIGLHKVNSPGFEVYITPTFEKAKGIIEAGADIVAFDATGRPRPDGLTVAEVVKRLHDLKVEVVADISTLEEGIQASRAGADYVSTTLSGYTPYSRQLEGPDFELLVDLVEALDTPIIAEGRIWTPAEAARALSLGAFAVVVGTAITRPQVITQRFVEAMAKAQ